MVRRVALLKRTVWMWSWGMSASSQSVSLVGPLSWPERELNWDIESRMWIEAFEAYSVHVGIFDARGWELILLSWVSVVNMKPGLALVKVCGRW
jgi:hypothetical protein